MANPVTTREQGNEFRITINRPEVKNALNLDTLHGLIAALRQSEASAARVVVLTGEGNAFCAGGDIQEMLARRGKATQTYERLRDGLGQIVQSMVLHSKPVIARIPGDAVGSGCGLAAAADVAIAVASARFGTPFVKVGLVPDTAASWLLPRALGMQNARRLLLSGDLVDAAEAHRMGLVTQVAPDAAALDKSVREWVEKFSAIPAGAIRDTKRLLATNPDLTLATALQQEAAIQGLRFTTDEHAKAVDAFLSGRKG